MAREAVGGVPHAPRHRLAPALEIYELATHPTPFKVLAFVINVAVVAYLLWAKRLFGVNGGVAAEHAIREADSGWPAIDAGTPPLAAGAHRRLSAHAAPELAVGRTAS